MEYHEPSDLGADPAAALYAAYIRHTYGTGSSTTTGFRQGSHLGQYSLANTTSDNNNVNGDQRQSVNRNFINVTGNNQQNTLQPLNQASVFQPTALQQMSHITAAAYNATCMLFDRSKHDPRLRYDISLSSTPVETTTRRHMGQVEAGVSNNYLGNPYLAANQSAKISDDVNTSVWMTNLPAHVTYKALLDNVRDCGKVRATVINEPENRHMTSAAKIVFFDVAGAQNLLRQANEGKFAVGAHIPRVVPNRIKTEAKPPGPESRVLHIEGPSCIVNQEYLTELFRGAGITWQNDEVIILSIRGTLTRLEWRFGSYRCQAEAARHAIDRVKKYTILPPDQASVWQCITVHFGVDPCASKSGKYPTQANFSMMFERADSLLVVPNSPTFEGSESPDAAYAQWGNPASNTGLFSIPPATQAPSGILPAFHGHIREPHLDNPPSYW